MEKKRGAYHELQKLGFEMLISRIQTLTFCKAFNVTYVNLFSIKTSKHITILNTFINKIHGGYREFPRLGFEMLISLIQVLAIIQNTSNISISYFPAVVRSFKHFHKWKILHPFRDDANKLCSYMCKKLECFPLECDENITLWESKLCYPFWCDVNICLSMFWIVRNIFLLIATKYLSLKSTNK